MQLNKDFFRSEFKELKKRYLRTTDDGEKRDIKYCADHFCIQFIDSGIDDIDFLLELMHSDAIFRHRKDFSERNIHVDYARLLHELPDETIQENFEEIIHLVTPSFVANNANCSAIEGVFEKLADNDDVDLEDIFKRFVDEGEHPFLFFNRGVFTQHGYSFEDLEQKYACHQMTAFA